MSSIGRATEISGAACGAVAAILPGRASRRSMTIKPRAPALKQLCHSRVELLGWSPGMELLSADSAESFTE